MRPAALLILLLPFCFSCSDDDGETAPPYVTTLGELLTGAGGKAVTFIPDGYTPRNVTSTHSGLAADSLYRVMVRALYTEENNVHLQQVAAVLSPMPRHIAEEKQKCDPVEVLALWGSGRYVNMRLALHTATEPHAFAFIEKGIEELPDGTRCLRLHLYHDRGNNPEYYTRETHLSCPIYQYADVSRPEEQRLRKGQDSVYFTITTYHGAQEIRLPYNN